MEYWRDEVRMQSVDKVLACCNELDEVDLTRIKLKVKLNIVLKEYLCDHNMLHIYRHPLVEAEFGKVKVCTHCGYEYSY